MVAGSSDTETLLLEFSQWKKVELVSDSQIPLYYQLARILEKFIREAKLEPDDQFPSEEAVGACFGVSRPTVNKAIQELLAQGWLNRVRGRGTFVKEDPRIQLTLLSDTMSPAEQFAPGTLKSRIVDRRVEEAVPYVAETLHLESGALVIFIRRLREVHGHPLCVCDSILPAGRFHGLGETPLLQGSLYTTIEERYNCPVVRSERWVEAAEAVEREVGELLDVPLLSPVLVLTGVSYTAGDEPIEIMTSYFREGISLKSTVTRPSRDLRAESSTTLPQSEVRP
jgi:GntR family transcriptional regulator